MFSSTAYIRVTKDRFRIRHLEMHTDTTVVAQSPFTTDRLLIGQFQSAEKTLKSALKQIGKGRLFIVKPRVVIHPLEMTDGGLSEVEERIFVEVALGAGAAKAIVWVGRELSDAEVKEKLRAR